MVKLLGHHPERGKSVCCAHSKQDHVIKVEAGRVVAVMEEYQGKYSTGTHPEIGKGAYCILFNGFYTEFNNNAKYFEIFDFDDVDLWKRKLKYKGVYIFTTIELALKAVSLDSNLKLAADCAEDGSVPLDNNSVHFQVCSQCNGYQVRFPFFRELRLDANQLDAPQKQMSRSFAPNLYSDSLCRKPNISHEKKKKGARRKFAEINNASSSGSNCDNPSPLIGGNFLAENPVMYISNIDVSNMNAPSSDNPFNAEFYNHSPIVGYSHEMQSPFMGNTFYTPVVSPIRQQNFQGAMTPVHYNNMQSPARSFYSITSNVVNNLNSMQSGLNQSARKDSFLGSFQAIKKANLPAVPLFNETSLSLLKINSKKRDNQIVEDEPAAKIRKLADDSRSVTTSLSSSTGIISQSNRNVEVFSPLFETGSFAVTPTLLKDSVALVLLENHKFRLFRSYLDNFKIFPASNSLRYCRFEFLRALSYLYEMIDYEFDHSSCPCLPVLNGIIISPSELFYFGQNPLSNVNPDHVSVLAQFEDIIRVATNVPNYYLIRDEIQQGFSDSLQNIEPYLSTRDSIVSLEEPLLYSSYEYLSSEILGLFNFNYTLQNYNSIVNKCCGNILETFDFYTRICFSNCKSSVVMSLKQLIAMSLKNIGIVSHRSRLLDLRSRVTLETLQFCTSMDLSAPAKCREWFHTVMNFCDYSTLTSYCMPNGFKWVDSPRVYQLMLRLSLSSTEIISINPNSNSKHSCVCHIIKIPCQHAEISSQKASRFPNTDFSLYSVVIHGFLQLAFDNFDELWTKIYISFLYEMQQRVSSTLDIYTRPATIIENVYPPGGLPCVAKYLDNSYTDDISSYRGSLMSSPVMNHIALLSSNHENRTSRISLNDSFVHLYRGSLLSTGSFLASDCSIEVGIQWINLAIKFGYISGDVASVAYSRWMLILVYFIWKRDFDIGVKESEDLISYCRSALLHLPPQVGDIHARRVCQSTIVRARAMLIQYSQHVQAGLSSPFFPGQLVQIQLSLVDKVEDVIYVAFAHSSKPMYIANLAQYGGCCWSCLGCDLTLLESWRSIAIDSYHLQFGSITSPLLCQRFILHALRSGAYSVEQFKQDLIVRSSFSGSSTV